MNAAAKNYKTCPHCGETIESTVTLCPACVRPIDRTAPSAPTQFPRQAKALMTSTPEVLDYTGGQPVANDKDAKKMRQKPSMLDVIVIIVALSCVVTCRMTGAVAVYYGTLAICIALRPLLTKLFAQKGEVDRA